MNRCANLDVSGLWFEFRISCVYAGCWSGIEGRMTALPSIYIRVEKWKKSAGRADFFRRWRKWLMVNEIRRHFFFR
jgi:hypothetical protein